MARSGITQVQVNAAADALLRAGERPTIERVRHALGTGSPNTLVRLLDSWWADLGRRLDAHATQLALPEAPESVVDAASQLWLAALEHAQTLAKTDLAEKMEALAAERAAMAVRDQQRNSELAAASEASRAAQEARISAETRVADLERLSDSLTEQRDDCLVQRKTAVDERDLLARRLIELQNTLEQTQREAITGRKLIEEQFRASENRWLQEVDRARTDASQAVASLAQVEKQHATALQAMEDRASALQAELAERERSQIRTEATADAQRIEIERLYNQLEPTAKGS